jgi:hypothetical protein
MLRLKSGTVLKLKTYFADTKVCDTIFRLKFEIDLVPYSKYVTQISRKYAPSQIGPYYEYVPQNSRACKRKYIFFSAPLEFWSHRLAVRTPGFHPGNRSSILRGITKEKRSPCVGVFLCSSTKFELRCKSRLQTRFGSKKES